MVILSMVQKSEEYELICMYVYIIYLLSLCKSTNICTYICIGTVFIYTHKVINESHLKKINMFFMSQKVRFQFLKPQQFVCPRGCHCPSVSGWAQRGRMGGSRNTFETGASGRLLLDG